MLPRFLLRYLLLAGLLLPASLRAQVQPKTPGAGLRGQYYAGKNFEKLVLTRLDPAVDFDWTIGPPTRTTDKSSQQFLAPGPGVPAEYFSVRWTGHVYIPTTGRYTFRTTSDDGMRVWVGGKKIINSWYDQEVTSVEGAVQLTGGRYYPLRVEYYQLYWDTRALLAWRLPDSEADFVPVPTSSLYATLPASAKPIPAPVPAPKPGGTIGITAAPARSSAPAGTATAVKPSAGTSVAGKVPAGIGLQATYYAGSVRGAAAHSRVEPVVNVTWRGEAPAPGVPGQGFSVRWTGYVVAPETGLYVLHTEWDDATDIRLADEDVLSMEKYEPEYFLPRKPPIPVDVVLSLTAGKFYRVYLAYKNVRGVSRAVLSWARPTELGSPTTLEAAFAAAEGRRLTVVPKQFLYPELPKPLPEAPPAVAASRPVPKPVPKSVPKPAAKPTARPAVVVQRPRPVPKLAAAPTPVPELPDLSALSKGAAVTLTNLYFTQSTATLLPTSRPLLNALARKLREQAGLRLEIAGHTDNVGEPALNLRLSEQRAQVVRRYLVQQGIDSTRLTAKGYGGTRPVADNRDPQQRPRNRRVEIVVQ